MDVAVFAYLHTQLAVMNNHGLHASLWHKYMHNSSYDSFYHDFFQLALIESATNFTQTYFGSA
jgi:hypothetical protein